MIPPHSWVVPGRNIEGVAKTHEPGGFDRTLDVEHARQHVGLVSDDADALSADAAEPCDDVRRVERLDFEEVAVIENRADDCVHIVRFVGRLGNNAVELVHQTLGVIIGCVARRVVHVVLRQVREKGLGKVVHVIFVRRDQMRNAALDGMRGRAAEFFERDLFTGNGLDDLRTGDEHLTDALGHDDKIRYRRRVDRAARARSGDQTDLWNHAACLDVPPKYLGITAQTDHALLNARAARVVDTYYW